jgi:hypothetical protein
MEATMDLSGVSDEEIREEIEGMQKFLDALMKGVGLGGREEAKKAELIHKIEAYKSELDKRHANRT